MHFSPARLLRIVPVVALILTLSSGCSAAKGSLAQAQTAADQSAPAAAPNEAKAAPSTAALPQNTISYTAEKAEAVNGIAHRFLSQSSAMLAMYLFIKKLLKIVHASLNLTFVDHSRVKTGI